MRFFKGNLWKDCPYSGFGIQVDWWEWQRCLIRLEPERWKLNFNLIEALIRLRQLTETRLFNVRNRVVILLCIVPLRTPFLFEASNELQRLLLKAPGRLFKLRSGGIKFLSSLPVIVRAFKGASMRTVV